jgi:tetratricopeptide (TPR) repeat protein
MLEAGAKFREYEILEEVGNYGRGLKAFKAYDRKARRVISLELLRPASPALLAQLEQETARRQTLHHPCFPVIYEAGTHEGYYFLAQEWVEGRNLAEILDERATLDPNEVAGLLLQLLEGLEALQTLGLAHGDLRLENLLVGRDGELKLTGLVGQQAGQGVPAYQSPEACRQQKIDGRSDLYVAGLLLFEMLTGETPFQAVNSQEMALRQIHQPPPHLSDAKLDAFFQKAVAKKPAQRYQTAAEMAASLRRLLPLPEDLVVESVMPLPAENISRRAALKLQAARPVVIETEVDRAVRTQARSGLRGVGALVAGVGLVLLLAVGAVALWIFVLGKPQTVSVAQNQAVVTPTAEGASPVPSNSQTAAVIVPTATLAVPPTVTPVPGTEPSVSVTTTVTPSPSPGPSTPETLLYSKASVAFEAGNWDDAAKAFEELLASYPDYHADDARYKLGQAYLALNKYAEAQRTYAPLEAKYPDFSVPGYSPDEFKHNLTEIYCKFGQQIARQDEVNKVLSVLNRCKDLGSSDPAIAKLLEAETLYKAGSEAAASSDPKSWKDAIDKLSNLYYNFDRPHRDTAKLLFDLYNRYGDDLKSKNKLQEAADSYCAAAKLDPAPDLDLTAQQKKCAEAQQALVTPTAPPTATPLPPATPTPFPTPTPLPTARPATPTPAPQPSPTATPQPWTGGTVKPRG